MSSVLRLNLPIILFKCRDFQQYNYIAKNKAQILSNREHYSNVIMSAMESQITSPMIVYSTDHSDADKKKTSKLRVTGLCEGNSPVTGEFRA